MNILEVDGLTIRDVRTGELVVQNLSFSLKQHSCLGIVGESGSGKSMSVKAILGLLHSGLQAEGSVRFRGKEILTASEDILRKIRGQHCCMILQDAMTAFNPLETIGAQMEETLLENTGCTRTDAKYWTIDAIEKMKIYQPEEVIRKYPHQMSGGMLQRCSIGLAMALRPEIIIADEPTTALDAINQREVLLEFKRLREETDLTLVFISHDLGVVEYLADEVMVMHAGKCVEFGGAKQMFFAPQNEYSRYLVNTRRRLAKEFLAVMQREEILSC